MSALPSSATLFDVLDTTWPAMQVADQGAFRLRRGGGGGKRVSAATSLAAATLDDILLAERGMMDLGQTPLFQLRDDERALDAVLVDRGYICVDPVTMYACPVDVLTKTLPPRTAAIAAWEPLSIMKEIWAQGGVGPERIAVMHRAEGPKTGFISRWNDQPAGAAFLAMHNNIGMVHALEVLPHQRRQGVARFLMHQAAHWTAKHGGTHLSVVCVTANTGANALYASLGMQVVGTYHYRQKSPL